MGRPTAQWSRLKAGYSDDLRSASAEHLVQFLGFRYRAREAGLCANFCARSLCIASSRSAAARTIRPFNGNGHNIGRLGACVPWPNGEAIGF